MHEEEVRMYTCEEVAQKLSMSESFIRREISKGALKAVRLGRLVRVPEAALAEYLSNKMREAGISGENSNAQT